LSSSLSCPIPANICKNGTKRQCLRLSLVVPISLPTSKTFVLSTEIFFKFIILIVDFLFHFFLSMETFSSKNMFLSVQNPKTYFCLLSRKKDQEKGQSHDPPIPVYEPASSSLTLVLDFTSQSRSRDLQSSSTGLQRSYACSNTFTVVPVQSSAAYSSFNRVFGSRTTALLWHIRLVHELQTNLNKAKYTRKFSSSKLDISIASSLGFRKLREDWAYESHCPECITTYVRYNQFHARSWI
jgi:hypothetical protein